MSCDFNIVVLATYTTDDEIVKICDKIPHSEEFVRLWVIPSAEQKKEENKN